MFPEHLSCFLDEATGSHYTAWGGEGTFTAAGFSILFCYTNCIILFLWEENNNDETYHFCVDRRRKLDDVETCLITKK